MTGRGQHQIRLDQCVSTFVDEGLKYEQAMARIKAADTGRIDRAAAAYSAACGKLMAAVTVLEQQAAAMAQCWGGKTASEAQVALQRLHATAKELAHKTGTMGENLGNFSRDLTRLRAKAPGYGRVAIDDHIYNAFGGDNNAHSNARKLLGEVNDRMAASFQALPPKVEKDLPTLPAPQVFTPRITPIGPIGDDPDIGSPPSPGPGSPAPPPPGAGPGIPGPDPIVSPGPGGPLAPVPIGADQVTDLAGVPDLAPGGLVGAEPYPGSLGTPPGSIAAPGPGAGPAPGLLGGGPAAAGAGGLAGARPGSGGMPPMGLIGGSRRDEEESERTTWLTEDMDVWKGATPPTMSTIF